MPARTVQFYTPIKEDIKNLLDQRSSNAMLLYVTGDKPPIATKIHPEVLPFFYELLNKIGKKDKISLFLYSSGGSLEAPWAIANLFKEYAKKLEIIIPYRAFSAATLLCLSADEVVMTPLSVLSPIDPTGVFKIKEETKPVQVEDIIGFIEFSKEKLGLVEQDALIEILKSLGSEIPPSILGSVNRTHSLIRKVAFQMLTLSKNKMSDAEKEKIVGNLTEKLFSHKHHISRREAKEVGLKSIKYASQNEERLINKIFKYFRQEMMLDRPFIPNEYLSESTNEHELTIPRAVISSSVGAYTFSSKYNIARQTTPDGKENVIVNETPLQWQKA